MKDCKVGYILIWVCDTQGGTDIWTAEASDFKYYSYEVTIIAPCIFRISMYHLSKVKSFPSLKAHWAALISISLALSQIPVFTLQDDEYGASASRSVPVYIPAHLGLNKLARQNTDGDSLRGINVASAWQFWIPLKMREWTQIPRDSTWRRNHLTPLRLVDCMQSDTDRCRVTATERYT